MKRNRWMKGIALAFAILLPHSGALAQGYYTLPEIREQAAQGWHETYKDAGFIPWADVK